jgi:hypothetical protein
MRSRLMLISICLALAASCGSRAKQLNLLLIGVDTLRPDHLGCYGYSRKTSPAVDAIARKGVPEENPKQEEIDGN